MKFLLVLVVCVLSWIRLEARETLQIRVLDARFYNQLPEKQKLEYLNALREEWNKFEKTYAIKPQKKFSFWDMIIPTAYAVESSSQCLIGGRIGKINVIQDSIVICEADRYKCTVDGIKNGFECGEIYGNICVNASFKNAISSNCFASSKKLILEPQAYRDAFEEITAAYEQLCHSGSITTQVSPQDQDGCISLSERIKYLEEQYRAIAQGSRSGTRSVNPTTAR